MDVNHELLDKLRAALRREQSLSVGLATEIVAATQHLSAMHAREADARSRIAVFPDDPRRGSMTAEQRNDLANAQAEQRRAARDTERLAGRTAVTEQGVLQRLADTAHRAGGAVDAVVEQFARNSQGVDPQVLAKRLPDRLNGPPSGRAATGRARGRAQRARTPRRSAASNAGRGRALARRPRPGAGGRGMSATIDSALTDRVAQLVREIEQIEAARVPIEEEVAAAPAHLDAIAARAEVSPSLWLSPATPPFSVATFEASTLGVWMLIDPEKTRRTITGRAERQARAWKGLRLSEADKQRRLTKLQHDLRVARARLEQRRREIEATTGEMQARVGDDQASGRWCRTRSTNWSQQATGDHDDAAH